MIEKTQAMRALEGKRIPYDVFVYADDMRDAEEIALFLDVDAHQVFKTLVVLPPEQGKKAFLVMVPANTQLDLKKLADVAGVKKLKMATHREAEQMTGLQVGGISAIALLGKPFTVYIDESALGLSHVYISAGKRGIQLKVGVTDLIKLTGARTAAATAE
jgi:Cys-tRNA(Pro)/Cys-tRNA(Cys) deacylase